MAEAAAHDEQMEHLVRTEILVAGVEERQLHRVDDAARRVDQPAGQQPDERAPRHCLQDAGDRQQTDPAHGDIEDRGEPFGAIDPEGFDQNARDGDDPDQGQQRPADAAAQHHYADRGVGTRDQDEDHHVVDLAQHAVHLRGNVKGMVNGAGRVQQDHAGGENGQGRGRGHSGIVVCLDEQRRRRQNRENHSDEMGDGAARLLDM